MLRQKKRMLDFCLNVLRSQEYSKLVAAIRLNGVSIINVTLTFRFPRHADVILKPLVQIGRVLATLVDDTFKPLKAHQKDRSLNSVKSAILCEFSAVLSIDEAMIAKRDAALTQCRVVSD